MSLFNPNNLPIGPNGQILSSDGSNNIWVNPLSIFTPASPATIIDNQGQSISFDANNPLTVKGSQINTSQNEVVSLIQGSELRLAVEYPIIIINKPTYTLDPNIDSDNIILIADTDTAGDNIIIDVNAYAKHQDNLLDQNNKKNRTKTITIKNTGKNGFFAQFQADVNIDWIGPTSDKIFDDEVLHY